MKIYKFKTFESNSYYKPDMKRPFDKKCLDLSFALDEIEKKFNLSGDKFLGSIEKLNIKNIIPIPQPWELEYEYEKQKYSNPQFKKMGIEPMKRIYYDYQSIILLPEYYNSEKDVEKYHKEKESFIIRMKKMGSQLGKDELNHINFGDKSFDWINKYLSAMKDLFGEYYEDGTIRCWMPKRDDWGDSKASWVYPEFDYEGEKAYFLSELEEWIDSFGLDTTGFYEWVLRYNFVEGRHWNRVWNYGFDEGFRKEKMPENISKINNMLGQLMKVDEIPIYFDYYKKINLR
jgi:hypothetical protein